MKPENVLVSDSFLNSTMISQHYQFPEHPKTNLNYALLFLVLIWVLLRANTWHDDVYRELSHHVSGDALVQCFSRSQVYPLGQQCFMSLQHTA